MKRSAWIVRAALIALLALPGLAAAQDARDQASSHMRIGSGFYEVNNFRKALFHYKKAQKLAPEAAGPYRELGKTHEALGHLKAAVKNYREYLDRKPDAKDRATITSYIFSIEEQTGIKSSGQLTVITTPAGATLRIDNPTAEPVGQTPLKSLRLLSGSYVLFVEYKGHEPAIKKVTLDRGEKKKLAIRLEKKARPESPPAVVAGKDPSKAEPPAKSTPKTVDPLLGKATAKLESKPEPQPAPEAAVQPSAAGVETRAERDSSLETILAWTAIGSSVAVVGTGIGLHVWAADRIGALDDDITSGQQIEYSHFTAEMDAAKQLELGAYIMYGAGAALLAAGGILLYLDSGNERDSTAGIGDGSPDVTVLAAPTGDGLGVLFQSRF